MKCVVVMAWWGVGSRGASPRRNSSLKLATTAEGEREGGVAAHEERGKSRVGVHEERAPSPEEV